MTWQKATKLGIVVTVLLIGVYDVCALTFGGVDATISRVLLRGGTMVPAIPFALGFVCGHLFWNQPAPKFPKGTEPAAVLPEEEKKA